MGNLRKRRMTRIFLFFLCYLIFLPVLTHNVNADYLVSRAVEHLSILSTNIGTRQVGSSGLRISFDYIQQFFLKAVSTSNQISYSREDFSGLLDSAGGQGIIYSDVPVFYALLKPFSGDLSHPILINSHVDTVPTSLGAFDDGIGVSSALSLFEFFSNSENLPLLKAPIVFIFNGCEEINLIGSQAWLKAVLLSPTNEKSLKSEIRNIFFTENGLYKAGFLLNLEGGGRGGRPYVLQRSVMKTSMLNRLLSLLHGKVNYSTLQNEMNSIHPYFRPVSDFNVFSPSSSVTVNLNKKRLLFPLLDSGSEESQRGKGADLSSPLLAAIPGVDLIHLEDAVGYHTHMDSLQDENQVSVDELLKDYLQVALTVAAGMMEGWTDADAEESISGVHVANIPFFGVLGISINSTHLIALSLIWFALAVSTFKRPGYPSPSSISVAVTTFLLFILFPLLSVIFTFCISLILEAILSKPLITALFQSTPKYLPACLFFILGMHQSTFWWSLFGSVMVKLARSRMMRNEDAIASKAASLIAEHNLKEQERHRSTILAEGLHEEATSSKGRRPVLSSFELMKKMQEQERLNEKLKRVAAKKNEEVNVNAVGTDDLVTFSPKLNILLHASTQCFYIFMAILLFVKGFDSFVLPLLSSLPVTLINLLEPPFSPSLTIKVEDTDTSDEEEEEEEKQKNKGGKGEKKSIKISKLIFTVLRFLSVLPALVFVLDGTTYLEVITRWSGNIRPLEFTLFAVSCSVIGFLSFPLLVSPLISPIHAVMGKATKAELKRNGYMTDHTDYSLLLSLKNILLKTFLTLLAAMACFSLLTSSSTSSSSSLASVHSIIFETFSRATYSDEDFVQVESGVLTNWNPFSDAFAFQKVCEVLSNGSDRMNVCPSQPESILSFLRQIPQAAVPKVSSHRHNASDPRRGTKDAPSADLYTLTPRTSCNLHMSRMSQIMCYLSQPGLHPNVQPFIKGGINLWSRFRINFLNSPLLEVERRKGNSEAPMAPSLRSSNKGSDYQDVPMVIAETLGEWTFDHIQQFVTRSIRRHSRKFDVGGSLDVALKLIPSDEVVKGERRNSMGFVIVGRGSFFELEACGVDEGKLRRSDDKKDDFVRVKMKSFVSVDELNVNALSNRNRNAFDDETWSVFDFYLSAIQSEPKLGCIKFLIVKGSERNGIAVQLDLELKAEFGALSITEINHSNIRDAELVLLPENGKDNKNSDHSSKHKNAKPKRMNVVQGVKNHLIIENWHQFANHRANKPSKIA
eukprot:GDKJ01036836.1.p1 GENE.GDKJ01036836.1~~GDKJ01036836.1.p1  ORF type:complete len:1254 (+),score=304.62 GDKJ01036836.1:232-3993(+)